MKKPPSISANDVAAVLSHHFGKPAKQIKAVAGGLANHVFEARVGREPLIVRISTRPSHLQVFTKEQWAIARAGENGVPVPEVLQVGNDIIGFPYMISRKVPGEPATAFRDCAPLLEQLGRHGAMINAIATTDFGPTFDWSPNKLSRHATWADYLDNGLEADKRCELLRRSGVMDRPKLTRLREQIKRMRQWNGSPALNHGDLRLKNVIHDGRGKIVAILDWEKCMSSLAPQWELSIALHDLTIDEKEMFLRGYGLDMKAYTGLAPGIKALNILNYAHTVRQAMKRKDHPLLASLGIRLNGHLDLHSL